MPGPGWLSAHLGSLQIASTPKFLPWRSLPPELAEDGYVLRLGIEGGRSMSHTRRPTSPTAAAAPPAPEAAGLRTNAAAGERAFALQAGGDLRRSRRAADSGPEGTLPGHRPTPFAMARSCRSQRCHCTAWLRIPRVLQYHFTMASEDLQAFELRVAAADGRQAKTIQLSTGRQKFWRSFPPTLLQCE